MKKRIASLFLCLVLAVGLVGAVGCSSEKARDVYKICARLDGNTLIATQEVTCRNRSKNAWNELKFNLFGNAYREGASRSPLPKSLQSAYYNGKSYGSMTVSDVSPCKSWSVGGTDETVLSVALEGELFPDESVTVTVEYTLQLAQVNHRTGIAGRSINLGNFYPILCVYEDGTGFYECEYSSNGDPFYSECADYSVELTVPRAFTAISSGQTLSATEQDDETVYEFAIENVRDFAIVLGKEYKTMQTVQDGVLLSYVYYDERNAAELFSVLQESVAFFARTFGAFPYKTYAAVQTGFCYGGMEYPGLCMVSDALSKQDAVYTTVHETAHQWWYAAVGNNQIEHAWLDEGLAEYSSLLFFEKYPDYAVSSGERLKQSERAFHALCSVQEQVFGKADTSMNRKLGEYGEYEYAVIAYDKGVLLADALRSGLGNRAFFSGLRRYYKQYSGAIASPSEFAASFKRSGAAEIVRSFTEGKAVL